MEKEIMLFWLKLVLSLFIVVLGFGVVSPTLVSMPSDLAVFFGYLNTFLVVPFVLYIVWRDQFR